VRRDHGLVKRQVRRFSPLDSKQCELLQLVDIVLGSLTSTATSLHKRELACHIRDRLQASLGRKLVCRTWSPQLQTRPVKP
jgi:hypothetical protein